MDRVERVQKLKADIISGNPGDLNYKVSFTNMQLVAQFGDSKLGVQDQLTISSDLVLAALFAKLPQGTITKDVEALIVKGLSLVE